MVVDSVITGEGEAVSQNHADVIIVGAGHNGLTAGSYLAKAGLSVLVVEATDKVGGMTSTNPVIAAAPDHRINEGAMDASLIRNTKIIEELELATKFGLREVALDPIYAALGADGASLCIYKDAERTADEIRQFSSSDARAFLELANAMDAVARIVIPYMNTNPVRPLAGGSLTGVLKAALRPKRLGPLARYLAASHAEAIDEHFTHPLVKAPLAALPCFVPMSEDGTGWALMFFGLHHHSGVARFVGGTGAITDALGRCFAAAGGKVRFDAVVDEVLVTGGRATGIRLEGGEELRARAVITTNNVKVALTDMLPDGALPEAMAERVKYIPTDSTNGASFKVDVALSGRLQLTQHQAQRTDDVDLRVPGLVYGTFEDHVNAWAACARGEMPDPLAGVAVIPTAADPTQAPDGQDTFWFWTGIAPAHPHVPWEDQAEATADRAIAHASKFIDGFDTLTIARQVMTPPKFEERFRSPDGNVYHVDPTATRFGPLRPTAGLAGYKTPIEGLFISGGGTHPSAGICGVPGQLAAKVVLKSLKGAADAPGPASGAVSTNAGDNGHVSTADRARAFAASRR
ncbi:MAG: putative oxidoreductase C10orf33 -like protein [Solirubrobacterales bacterium]|nr:putative oxidoreductase C10orf33 -like protein [Solirubrobacterales bacterium]